ncbi:MAG: hypothetical protein OHK0019_13330 [Saprospiraceae bacterium]
MQIIRLNIEDWLRQEAHVVTGRPFHLDDCSCVPVAPQNRSEAIETPVGFLITHGKDISFVETHSPDGARILDAWNKIHQQEIEEEKENLPAECWYG